MQDTTIAAIATAYGESGIGVIRLSGSESLSIAKKLFCPGKSGISAEKKGFSLKPRYMHYGYIKDPKNGKLLDEALCVYMKAPASYTGEDCVEIQCHGSMLSLRSVLALCLENGAEAAEKGEFTKRAFLHGKLDLAQAEAVMDLIKAGSSRSFSAAAGQLTGVLSRQVESLRKALLEILVSVTVEMDYPDEDIEEMTAARLQEAISAVLADMRRLLASAEEGRIVREGLSLAIVGRPNVGKSSLMNALLKENRSIVTQIPGTTRDTVEEKAVLRGISVRLTDTAGIRKTEDLVESLGIERSREALDRADIVLLMLDGSAPLTQEDISLLQAVSQKRCICILNKEDLGLCMAEAELKAFGAFPICSMSLAKGKGLSALLDTVEKLAFGEGFRRNEDPVLTNVRHIRLLQQAAESLKSALAMLSLGQALDFIEVDVRSAFDALGEITGDTASDEVISAVFERFCLGK